MAVDGAVAEDRITALNINDPAEHLIFE